ncbi:transposase [Nitratidesulfovibrio sp. HK-II]
MDLLHEEILSGPVLNLDETTVQVLKEPGRKTSKSYMWLARGGSPGKPGVLFHSSPSRSGEIAEELVRDFSGYLQADGYVGYNALGELMWAVWRTCTQGHGRAQGPDKETWHCS